jgi:hypothetical protein
MKSEIYHQRSWIICAMQICLNQGMIPSWSKKASRPSPDFFATLQRWRSFGLRGGSQGCGVSMSWRPISAILARQAGKFKGPNIGVIYHGCLRNAYIQCYSLKRRGHFQWEEMFRKCFQHQWGYLHLYSLYRYISIPSLIGKRWF